ncbi:MAG: c-type cytochrome [Planctomycetes bacterium]|nr:c-type cytochrome [Planctomycetota bacterium]
MGMMAEGLKRDRIEFMICAFLAWMAVGCQPSAPPPTPRQDTTRGDAGVGGQRTSGETAVPVAVATKPLTATELYTRHCAACHGDQGDGQGLAARFIYPKPRNLRASPYRLVSTVNGVPSREDIEAMLVRGMPGSAMPSWAHLSPRDRSLLVDEVLRFRREGAREEIIRTLKEQGEEQIDEQEVKQFVENRTLPAAVFAVPAIGPPDAKSIARGKELYVKQSCHSCHGNEGRGDGQQKMVDAEGLPTRPRDLTRGIYKGSPDPTSFYRRIALGMPGTPMPASANLKPEEITDLVNFLRSLSTDAQREASLLKREQIVAKYVAKLPGDQASSQWEMSPAVRLRMTPLWWRDDADPGLTVQAVHDGRDIAIRLRWQDATSNSDAARTQAFRDAIAVELYRGTVEPFLGMGSTDAPVDVWFWQAEPPTGPPDVEQIYPRTVVDQYPLSEKTVSTAEYQRPGTQRKEQPDISLPAKASGNPVVPAAGASGSSSLTASGPGSVAFRLPKSRLVTARGQWREGRWTVVMTRPLVVEGASGVSLVPGERASIALAVWDGDHRDRNGQKLISIWQDLLLEKPPH